MNRLMLANFALVLLWTATRVIGVEPPSLPITKPLASTPKNRESANDEKNPPFEVVEVRGKVVPYKAALKRLNGISLVGSLGKDQLAMETENGRLLPILPTEGARFFLQDPRNLGRPMQITARVYRNTPGLQILTIHSIKDGKLQEIYYWCEVCSIQLFQLQECVCCQGPLELREHPIGEPYHFQEEK